MVFEALIAVSVLGMAALTTATVWSRKNTWLRGAAVAGWFALAPVSAGIGLFALSHPVTHHPLLVPGGEYLVLGMKLDQQKGIFLFLDFGRDHPRAVRLPWDSETAKKLQALMRAQQRGDIPGFTGVFPPFDPSLDTNPPQFHALPQPRAPMPKRRQEDDPLRYERST